MVLSLLLIFLLVVLPEYCFAALSIPADEFAEDLRRLEVARCSVSGEPSDLFDFSYPGVSVTMYFFYDCCTSFLFLFGNGSLSTCRLILFFDPVFLSL